MKTLLLSTAILSATALAAMAQDTAPETAPADEETSDTAAPDSTDPDAAPVDEEATDMAAPDTPAADSEWDAGFVDAEESDLTSERLTGAPLYGPTGDEVGEVSEIIIGADEEKIESVIVDVGGFLGIGEKPVELPLEDLDVMRSDENDDLRIGTSMTEEELEEMPEYTD